MRKLLLWLLRLVTHNIGWKLLALAIAAMLWVVVASEPEMSTFANVPLEYKNMPQDMEISSTLLESVYLELRGPSGELGRMNDLRRPSVVLDMVGMLPGEHTLPIRDGNVHLARGLRLVRSIPSQVRFEFERRAYHNVPVRVRFDLEHQDEYQVASYHVVPSELQVVGPETHVRRLAAVSTDPVKLAGLIGKAEFRVNAFIEDPYVRFQSAPTVVVTVAMKRK